MLHVLGVVVTIYSLTDVADQLLKTLMIGRDQSSDLDLDELQLTLEF